MLVGRNFDLDSRYFLSIRKWEIVINCPKSVIKYLLFVAGAWMVWPGKSVKTIVGGLILLGTLDQATKYPTYYNRSKPAVYRHQVTSGICSFLSSKKAEQVPSFLIVFHCNQNRPNQFFITPIFLTFNPGFDLVPEHTNIFTSKWYHAWAWNLAGLITILFGCQIHDCRTNMNLIRVPHHASSLNNDNRNRVWESLHVSTEGLFHESSLIPRNAL